VLSAFLRAKTEINAIFSLCKKKFMRHGASCLQEATWSGGPTATTGASSEERPGPPQTCSCQAMVAAELRQNQVVRLYFIVHWNPPR
jgi:hypothetical protein